jgi:hypothetical protein
MKGCAHVYKVKYILILINGFDVNWCIKIQKWGKTTPG